MELNKHKLRLSVWPYCTVHYIYNLSSRQWSHEVSIASLIFWMGTFRRSKVNDLPSVMDSAEDPSSLCPGVLLQCVASCTRLSAPTLSLAWLGSLNMDCSPSFPKICLFCIHLPGPLSHNHSQLAAHSLPGSSVQPVLWRGPAFGDWCVTQQVEDMAQKMRAGKLLEPHA